ncbi:ras-related protein RABH1d-like [Olea europaea var. sylvestris]|uniref:ras-related protein RABH1d-like n=1 Tax=Olea europaea var. sylvestris TaxID=158386 RepID=UPI000C1CF9B9|nr:ras-related protein RABH1d-like [Olea europaea var. sylvestris]
MTGHRDTTGPERFRSLIPSYIRDSSVAVIAYDVGRNKTDLVERRCGENFHDFLPLPLFLKIFAALPGMEAFSSTKQEDMVDMNLKPTTNTTQTKQQGGAKMSMEESSSGAMIKLTITNYILWRPRMEDLLSCKDLYDLLEIKGDKCICPLEDSGGHVPGQDRLKQSPVDEAFGESEIKEWNFSC